MKATVPSIGISYFKAYFSATGTVASLRGNRMIATSE